MEFMALSPAQAQRARNLGDFRQERTIRKIAAEYGVFALPDGRELIKFGLNDDVGVSTDPETVWSVGGLWNEFDGNLINSISSDDAADVGQVLSIQGYTQDPVTGDLTFHAGDTVTLNGQTRVALPRNYHTITRVFTANGTFASPATEFAGTVWVYQFEAGDTVTGGVPQDVTRVAARVDAVNQQTQICASAISSTQFFVVDQYEVQIYRKSSGYTEGKLKVKELGGVWRTRNEISVPATQGWNEKNFKRPFLIPPNSKFKVDVLVGQNDTFVSAEVSGELYRIIDDAPGAV
jgi:hypothetical protein